MSGAVEFVFAPDVSLDDAEMTLHLAMFALEGLAGRVRVRLDAHYRIDPEGRALFLATDNRVARMVVRVFAALLAREVGEDSFHVIAVDALPQSLEQERIVPA
jgi:hypothetical protein